MKSIKFLKICLKNSLLLFNVILLFFILFNGINCFSQSAAINTIGATANPSAILDVNSTNQGILIPRLTTTQRNLLPSPAIGLLIYNTSTNLFNYYNGSKWYEIGVTFVSSTTGAVHPGEGVSVNATNALPDSSAILDINDLSRGILVPRPTWAIIAPTTGLIIYNTITNRFNYYNGSLWIAPCATSTGVSGATGSQSSVGAAINLSGSTADASAILDVSAADKGMLIPRLTTTDRNNIKAVTGLTIYNTTTNAIEYYNGSGWYMLEYHVPSITATPSSQTICSGVATGIILTSDISGTTFAWTVTQSGVTGATAGSGSSIAQILTNSGTTVGTATYSITPTTSGCVGTSTNVVITVNPNLPASVSIAAVPSLTICSGTSVTFTATPTNGGTPTYQWQLNGSNVGVNNSAYTNNTLATGNTIRCIMTSNATCVTGSPATSNTATIFISVPSAHYWGYDYGAGNGDASIVLDGNNCQRGIGSDGIPLTVIVSLCNATLLGNFEAYTPLQPNPYSVYLPASIAVYTSPDNITYTLRGSMTHIGQICASDPYEPVDKWTLTLGTSVSAQYVKYVFQNNATYGRWVFCCETKQY